MSPVKTKFIGNGNTHIEQWMMDGKLHRENGPAYTEYSEDNKILLEQWYCHGQIHNSNGPASITYVYFDSLCVPDMEYCILGYRVSEESHNILVKLLVNRDRSTAILNIKNADAGVCAVCKLLLDGGLDRYDNI
jgi:hypothetical protein